MASLEDKERLMNSDAIRLWVLAILPGLLHPLLLFIYFWKYRERAGLTSRLLTTPVFVFALATVPVPAVLKWLQDTANQRFYLGITAAGAAPRWELIQGVAAALGIAEADVKSMAQNLWEDPRVGRIWALWWNSDDTDGGKVTGVVPSRELGQAEAA